MSGTSLARSGTTGCTSGGGKSGPTLTRGLPHPGAPFRATPPSGPDPLGILAQPAGGIDGFEDIVGMQVPSGDAKGVAALANTEIGRA